MKERPILFSGEMIRAIQDGRKSMTRRTRGLEYINNNPEGWTVTTMGDMWNFYADGFWCHVKCPYGKPGDRLWVRERFQLTTGDFAPTLEEELSKKPRPMYYADDNPRYRDKDKWKPSIHMPRWASRILLEITDIKCEKIKQISDKDIILEGFKTREDFYGVIMKLNKMKNREEALNKWCWVLDFKRIKIT